MVFIHKIIFFDDNKVNIETYHKKLSGLPLNLEFMHTLFEDLIDMHSIHIVISPTNSFLSMTGGIDKTFIKLFPNIEDKLRTKMISKAYAKSTIEYRGTKYILPMGKSILAETGNPKCHFILASPTMTMPKDINNTKNIYMCMKTIFKKLKLIKVPIIIACPCLGTGIGNLSPNDSASQIKQAIINADKK